MSMVDPDGVEERRDRARRWAFGAWLLLGALATVLTLLAGLVSR